MLIRSPIKTSRLQLLIIYTLRTTARQNDVISRFSLSSLSNLKIPVEHVPNDSSHKKVNVLNRVMEDVFICITFKTISQTKLIDLMWTLNWLIDCCFYYFTAWLSRYMHTFCFLFTIFLSHDFGRTKEIIYKILVGLRNKDPIRVFPGGRVHSLIWAI